MRHRNIRTLYKIIIACGVEILDISVTAVFMYIFELSDLLLTSFELSDELYTVAFFSVFQFRHREQNNRPTVADKPKIHALGATGAFSRLHAKLTGVGC